MFLGSNWGLVRSNYRPTLLYRGISDSRVSQIPIFMFEKDRSNDLGYFGLELGAPQLRVEEARSSGACVMQMVAFRRAGTHP
jgi:hypothetical protein